jgi:hypothetical protein
VTITTNLGLQKPGDDGILDIKIIDANMDIIDGAVAGKSDNGHTHNAADVGAVPTTRTINGKGLSGNITLTSTDVAAYPTAGSTSIVINGYTVTVEA